MFYAPELATDAFRSTNFNTHTNTHRLTVADVSVVHPGADTFVSAAAATAGAVAKVRDHQKYRKYNHAASAVYRMVPLLHESYGRLGRPSAERVSHLG